MSSELLSKPFIPNPKEPEVLLLTANGKEIRRGEEKGTIVFDGIAYRNVGEDSIVPGGEYLLYRNYVYVEQIDGDQKVIICQQDVAKVIADGGEFDIPVVKPFLNEEEEQSDTIPEVIGTVRGVAVMPLNSDDIHNAYFRHVVFPLREKVYKEEFDFSSLGEDDFITHDQSKWLEPGQATTVTLDLLYVPVEPLWESNR